ncbi:MAG: peptidoglycan DD-metalloendopeptidase family protein [bacterium]|nr:peptidoglycan DD-metalloendopeptidase family protein [bacterium]
MPLNREPRWSAYGRAAAVLATVACIVVGSSSVLAAEQSSEVKEIFDLNKAIDAKSNRLEDIQTQIERYRASIQKAQGTAQSLTNRLRTLDDRIARQKLEIERVQVEREQVGLEITATSIALDEARTNVEQRRRMLAALLTEVRAADARPQMHVVLASDSVGAYYAQRNQLAQVQQHLRGILAAVRFEREQLTADDRALAERNAELTALDEELRDEQASLNQEQDTKQQLLTTTWSNEQRYQQIIRDLKAEVAAIDAEIVALENAVRAKLERIDEHFGALGRVAFSWPVPNRGITAYFHDPEYPYRHIFEHPAVDIRAAQGSTIVAPAPGYVAKTKDNGMGYSYVMLVHPGGFSTVYGHVSCFKVQEGTYVDRGDPIACVGGRPGTRGAGSLTSGAHLHFEVRLNGIPVNPLNYLL